MLVEGTAVAGHVRQVIAVLSGFSMCMSLSVPKHLVEWKKEEVFTSSGSLTQVLMYYKL